jgi:hypothetical protein
VLEDTSSVNETDRPYLSVVVTSRNDDHGGDPTKRLQTFVQCFDAQCRQFGLRAEVIIVEWNPPVDKPRLSTLLQWPMSCACTYRFIEVPAALHERLEFADVLPLFQMIAKNVGVRRARGEFILATNIDIIFSNELVEWLASRRLDTRCMYRADRHDVGSQVPVDLPLQAQLDYCATHQLRVHRQWGTEAVDSCGESLPVANDIVDGQTVRLGSGWHVPEGTAPSCYRWAMERAIIHVDCNAPLNVGPLALEVELEPNPYMPGTWFDLQAVTESNAVSTRVHVTSRCVFRMPIGSNRIDDTLELRVVRRPDEPSRLPTFERRGSMLYVVRSIRVVAAADERVPLPFALPSHGWRPIDPVTVETDAVADTICVTTTERQWSYCLEYGPLKAPQTGIYQFAVSADVMSGAIAAGVLSGRTRNWLPASVTEMLTPAGYLTTIAVQVQKGTTFSIMLSNSAQTGVDATRFVVRELRASVESAKILALAAIRPSTPVERRQSLLGGRIWPPRYLDEVMPFSLDGWKLANSPEVTSATREDDGLAIVSHGQKGSYCLEYGPLRAPHSGMYSFSVAYDIRYGSVFGGLLSHTKRHWLKATSREIIDNEHRVMTVQAHLGAGQVCWLMLSNGHENADSGSEFVIRSVMASAVLRHVVLYYFDLVADACTRGGLRLVASLRRVVDLVRRSLWAVTRKWEARRIRNLSRRSIGDAPQYGALRDAHTALQEQHAVAIDRVTRLSEMEPLQVLLQRNRPDPLHLNGCGDFQLMARQHWFDLRGYAELETFSMNIDSLLSNAAHYSGIREVVLEPPLRIYHLEHEKGSGWTPEGEALLRRRIAARGITWLEARDVSMWSAYMHWLHKPLICNTVDWGLGAVELREFRKSTAVESVDI